MKRLYVMTKKEWKEFRKNTAADTQKLMQEEYQRGYAAAGRQVDVLVAALVTALKVSPTDTASIDVDSELIGQVYAGLITSGGRIVVHTYPKSLLPS